jgi:hypothetical protein
MNKEIIMDKIQEEFKEWMRVERRVWTSMCETNYDLDKDGRFEDSEVFMFFISYQGGKKATDLLPTEKVCPECGGKGYFYPKTQVGGSYKITCLTCKGEKVIQIYYTPEQYEKIMGKPYPGNALVWRLDECKKWDYSKYHEAKAMITYEIVIVQTAQPSPPTDYRPEE